MAGQISIYFSVCGMTTMNHNHTTSEIHSNEGVIKIFGVVVEEKYSLGDGFFS